MTGTAVDLIWLPPALALLGFVLNGTLALTRPTAKTLVSVIGAGVLLAAFAASIAVFSAFVGLHADEPVVLRYWSWIPVGTLQGDVALQVDQLSLVMLLVVTGVGSLIHLFSIGYMKEDPGYARYFAYLNLFVFFMLVLVLGASFPVMFVGWEGVGLCSYLLIGFWYNDAANATAGRKAFIMNRIGDFGFMVAMFMIFWSTGSLDFGTVFTHAPNALAAGGRTVTVITLFLFLGCTGKSAQIPLYTWLPDAMAGPTPVSALIHAATMVTAGVYLVARCNLLFAMAPVSSAVVAGVGALTALFAATIALKQWDIKKVLAYSTISQLGYMFLGVGTGAISAGMFHLITHAFFKALLFLGSGSVIHALSGEQDMRKMGALWAKIPTTAKTFLAGTLAIAGIPPLAGFFSKDEILGKTFEHSPGLWLIGFITAGLTALYMFRLVFMTFFGRSRVDHEVEHHIHESPKTMTVPLMILAVLSVIGGWIGWPAALGGSNRFEHFLEPVVAARSSENSWSAHGAAVASHSAETEYGLMLASVLIALVGIWLAYQLYIKNPATPGKLAASWPWLYRIVYRKYYVDEIYDAMFVNRAKDLGTALGVFDARIVDRLGVDGTGWLTRFTSDVSIWWDKWIVDGLVNFAGRVVQIASYPVRMLQTGLFSSYALLIVLGVIILLGYYGHRVMQLLR